jgi:hypothetical protein
MIDIELAWSYKRITEMDWVMIRIRATVVDLIERV